MQVIRQFHVVVVSFMPTEKGRRLPRDRNMQSGVIIVLGVVVKINGNHKHRIWAI
jgi:hypothetical protein